MSIPFETVVRITNTNKGYEIEVTLESKDSSKPLTVSRKRICADLNNIPGIREEAAVEYNLKENKML